MCARARELDWVGRPVIGDGQYAHVEDGRAIRAPCRIRIPASVERRGVARYAGAVFARSAARFKLAAIAAAQAGFTKAYDLLEGFEGDKDGQGHRQDGVRLVLPAACRGLAREGAWSALERRIEAGQYSVRYRTAGLLEPPVGSQPSRGTDR